MSHLLCVHDTCIQVLCCFVLFRVTQSDVSNVALNKAASQSSTLHWAKEGHTFFYWNATYAVDGKTDKRTSADIEINACCSGTDVHPWPSWWEVDLGTEYSIDEVIIYGRTSDPPVQLRGFKLMIQLQPRIMMSSNPKYTDNTTKAQYNFSRGIIRIPLEVKTIGRYVSVEMTNHFQQNPPIVICEVKVLGDCPRGTYGDTCGQQCGYCKDNENCDTQSGQCTNGCQPGYKGYFCKEDINLIKRVKEQVYVSMSSVYQTYDPVNAVDFREDTDADNCRCCAGALSGPSWWRLDLGKQYPIKFIIFIGRSDVYRWQSRNFTVYKGFGNSPDGRHFLYHNNASSGHKFIIVLDPPVVLQRLEVTNQIMLTICELKLIESEVCPSGLFGPHCRQECHCIDTSPCNRTDGVCHSPGCEPGWRGRSCNAACLNGTFGQDCRYPCHCLDDQSCYHMDGSCPLGLCASGWQADNCNIACDAGKFGVNCSSPCLCFDNGPCIHTNGSCPSAICAPGWQGDNCSIACEDGLFGPGCAFPCHCLDNTPCQRFNGSCPFGLCGPGRQGDNCSIGTKGLSGLKNNLPIGTVVGPTTTVIALFAVIVGVLVYRKRRLSKARNTDARNHPPAGEVSSDLKLNMCKNTTYEQDYETDIDNIEHIYQEVKEVNGKISLKQLWNFMEMETKDGFKNLHDEFKGTQRDSPERSLILSRIAKKKNKNNNDNNTCASSSVMVTKDGNSLFSKLDAQYIDGYSKKRKFIATPDPSRQTVNAFWELAYQENTTLIVMFMESLQGQCVQYWPSEGTAVYGQVMVQIIKFTTYSDHVVRTFVVSKVVYILCPIKLKRMI